MKRFLIYILPLLICFSCEINPVPQPSPEPEDTDKYGVEYMFTDSENLAELHICIDLDEWNRLLAMYDANKLTKQYIKANLRYVKGSDEYEVENIGLKLKGNSSRRRPEENGAKHQVNFSLSFRHYVDDPSQEINNCSGVRLKYFNGDPTYAREPYCLQVFRESGVWTAQYSTYCKLWLKIEQEEKEYYYGVYQLMEPVNKTYLKQRKDMFGSSKGNLWKCRYWSKFNGEWASTGVDMGGDEQYIYEYKMDSADFALAKLQLRSFERKLNTLSGSELHDWLAVVFDIPLLLKTYAINVVVGMWDDYWNNANNYYMYFNSKDTSSYKAYFIPYDYDISLGTSNNCKYQSDSGRQNPLRWGDPSNPMIEKVLQFEDFEQIYKDELLALVAPGAFLEEKNAVRHIRAMQNRIKLYVSNDLGDNMSIYDAPAGWGNHPEYKIMSAGENNFFRVKTETINKYCK